MIHSRSAYDELILLLSEYKKTNTELCGNIHFFSGNKDQAMKLVDLNFSIQLDILGLKLSNKKIVVYFK